MKVIEEKINNFSIKPNFLIFDGNNKDYNFLINVSNYFISNINTFINSNMIPWIKITTNDNCGLNIYATQLLIINNTLSIFNIVRFITKSKINPEIIEEKFNEIWEKLKT